MEAPKREQARNIRFKSGYRLVHMQTPTIKAARMQSGQRPQMIIKVRTALGLLAA